MRDMSALLLAATAWAQGEKGELNFEKMRTSKKKMQILSECARPTTDTQ